MKSIITLALAGIFLTSCTGRNHDSWPRIPHFHVILGMARAMCDNAGSPGYVTFEGYDRESSVVTFRCKNGEKHVLLSR